MLSRQGSSCWGCLAVFSDHNWTLAVTALDIRGLSTFLVRRITNEVRAREGARTASPPQRDVDKRAFQTGNAQCVYPVRRISGR